MNNNDLGIPHIKHFVYSISPVFEEKPWVLFLLFIIILTFFYFYPVKTPAFFIGIFVSVLIAATMYLLFKKGVLNDTQLTGMEQSILSGFVAGTAGFMTGLWVENTFQPLRQMFHPASQAPLS